MGFHKNQLILLEDLFASNRNSIRIEHEEHGTYIYINDELFDEFEDLLEATEELAAIVKANTYDDK